MEIKKTEKIKILIVTPNSGGPVTYVKVLSKYLPENGYEVRVVNFDSVKKYPKILRHIFFTTAIFRATKGVDIVYAQDPVSTGLPALIASKMANKRFFLKVVGDYAWEQGVQRFGVNEGLDEFLKMNKYPLLVSFFRRIEILVARQAEKIIVPSKYLKGVVEKWGIDRNKIEVVYNGFAGFDFNTDHLNSAKSLGFKFPTIVSSGRLVPWKGFHTLIDAMVLVKEKYSDVKLYILDDGPDRKKLEEKVKKSNLEENVVFVGRIPINEVYRYINGADIFTLLSSYEGFSHLLLEAMALGTPIITTPVGGNVELINNDINGVFVPYGDKEKTASAIIDLIQNESKRGRFSNEGLQRIKQFSESQMINKLIAILR
jgi:glycosyltransferase involved in cell wall biosynthesis